MKQCGKIQLSQIGTDDNIIQRPNRCKNRCTLIIFLYYTFYVQLYDIHKESFIVYRQHTKHLIQKLAT